MSIDTFDQVKTALRNWSERQDLSDDIVEQCIFFAENDVSSRIRVPAMESTATLAVTDGSSLIPFDFLELRKMEFNGSSLVYLPWDQFLAQRGAQSPNVMYYSRQGARWYFSGLPGDTDTITCYYYRLIPSLSNDNTNNWLLQVSPQCYLYGGLKYIYEYLMQTERAAYWAQKLMDEINKLQAMAEMSEHRGSSIAVRSL
jgi:hypothetical protein